MGPEEKNELKKENLNSKTNQGSQGPKLTYSQVLSSHLKLGNDNVAVINKKSSKKVDCESHSINKAPQGDQNQPHKFNFSSR